MVSRLRNILNWLYPLFGFLLPLQTRWIVRERIVGDSVWEYGRISMYGFDIVLLCIVALVIFIRLAAGRDGYRRHLWYLGGLGALFVGYELFFSIDTALTAVVLARVFSISIAAWYVFHHCDPIIIRRTLAAFVLSMILSAGFGVLQFFTQDFLMSSKWLGLSVHDAATHGVSVVETVEGRWLRAYGTFPHPNALGGFSALALTLFFFLAATSSPRMLSLSFRGHMLQLCEQIFFIMCPLILLAGVVTSVSRAALIACMASLVLFIVIFRARVLYHRTIHALIAVLISFLVFIVVLFPILQPRVTGSGRLEDISIVKRVSALHDTQTLVRHEGLWGTGLGAYTAALQQYFPDRPIWDQQPVHNIPLLLLVELGLVGIFIIVVTLCIMLIKFPISNFQFPNKPQIQNSKFQIPFIVCWFILAMLDHYFWTLPTGLYMSIFLCSFLLFPRNID